MNKFGKQLLQKLVENHQITQNEADHLEVIALQKNIDIETLLFEKSNIEKQEIIKAIAEVKNIPYVNLSSLPIDSQAIGFISESIARKYNILPYKYNQSTSTLYIASNNPENITMIDFLEKKPIKKLF